MKLIDHLKKNLNRPKLKEFMLMLGIDILFILLILFLFGLTNVYLKINNFPLSIDNPEIQDMYKYADKLGNMDYDPYDLSKAEENIVKVKTSIYYVVFRASLIVFIFITLLSLLSAFLEGYTWQRLKKKRFNMKIFVNNFYFMFLSLVSFILLMILLINVLNILASLAIFLVLFIFMIYLYTFFSVNMDENFKESLKVTFSKIKRTYRLILPSLMIVVLFTILFIILTYVNSFYPPLSYLSMLILFAYLTYSKYYIYNVTKDI